MAHIKHLFFHDSNRKDCTVRVTLLMKPAGEANIDVQIPQVFHDCLMRIPQCAADLHEQQMRAQILADSQPKQDGGP
jgi:hypothetical protein